MVLPKNHIDHFIDMESEAASRMMCIAHKLGQKIRQKLNLPRVGFIVAGFGVPHTHLHVQPLWEEHDVTSARYLDTSKTPPVFDLRVVDVADPKRQEEISRAFFVTGHYLGGIYSDERTAYRGDLVNHMLHSAHDYAAKKAESESCSSYLDDTPLNALIVPELEKLPTSPLYICMVRSVPGVVKSLESSFNSGREWAGKNEEERVSLWGKFYAGCNELPFDRTLFVSYEDFVLNPEENIRSIDLFLERHGVATGEMDASVLGKVHANGQHGNAFLVEAGKVSPTEAQRRSVFNAVSQVPYFEKSYAAIIKDTHETISSRISLCGRSLG